MSTNRGCELDPRSIERMVSHSIERQNLVKQQIISTLGSETPRLTNGTYSSHTRPIITIASSTNRGYQVNLWN
jgi:hypothetical protein